MALKAVGHPHDPFDSIHKDPNSLGEASSFAGSWTCDFNLQDDDVKVLLGMLETNNSLSHHHKLGQPPSGFIGTWESLYSSSSPSITDMQPGCDNLWWMSAVSSNDETPSTLQDCSHAAGLPYTAPIASDRQPVGVDATASSCRRKRRRSKSTKNKEEIENQRMTHIAVERNRRRQMNEYLASLRSLMPTSYVQRGDQASIIGGAIDFVKELEQMLQTMEPKKRNRDQKQVKRQEDDPKQVVTCSPLADFFSFSQYSTRPAEKAENKSSANADIEVTMVESHANLKLLTKKRPRQLTKIITGLQRLRLSVQHLSLTTVEEMVLHSISLRVEEGCQLNTVDVIAGAVNEMIQEIKDEEEFSLN